MKCVWYLHVIDIQDCEFVDQLKGLCDMNLSWKELAHEMFLLKEYANVSVYDIDEKLIHNESSFEPTRDDSLWHTRVQYKDPSSEPSDVEICAIYKRS